MSLLEDEKRARSKNNKRLVWHLFNNPKATFSTVSMENMNFPPRPVIKKNTDALEFLFRPNLKLVSDADCSEDAPCLTTP